MANYLVEASLSKAYKFNSMNGKLVPSCPPHRLILTGLTLKTPFKLQEVLRNDITGEVLDHFYKIGDHFFFI